MRAPGACVALAVALVLSGCGNGGEAPSIADRKTLLIGVKPDQLVTFGGPYYVAHQDTLVRTGDTHIGDVRDLKGKRLCQVSGSVSWRRVTEERKVAAKLVPAAAYGECLTKLTGGQVDAISTDDLILAGLAATAHGRVKIINAPISDEKYGIGMRLGDLDGCEAVNQAITEMYQDGTAAALLKRWFGNTSLKPATIVPQFEGCG
jgi:glutamate transport system substrate-binding protein